MLNPKRQQAAWYEDPYEILGSKGHERLKGAPPVQPVIWDTGKFKDGYEGELQKIKILRVRKRKRQANESLRVMLLLMED